MVLTARRHEVAVKVGRGARRDRDADRARRRARRARRV